MDYKPEDVVVTITLPDGTKHVCNGWTEKCTIYSEKSYHTTLDGEWKIELDDPK